MRGTELRKIRESWGLTQREMSNLLSCHVQTVSEMERGKSLSQRARSSPSGLTPFTVGAR